MPHCHPATPDGLLLDGNYHKVDTPIKENNQRVFELVMDPNELFVNGATKEGIPEECCWTSWCDGIASAEWRSHHQVFMNAEEPPLGSVDLPSGRAGLPGSARYSSPSTDSTPSGLGSRFLHTSGIRPHTSSLLSPHYCRQGPPSHRWRELEQAASSTCSYTSWGNSLSNTKISSPGKLYVK